MSQGVRHTLVRLKRRFATNPCGFYDSFDKAHSALAANKFITKLLTYKIAQVYYSPCRYAEALQAQSSSTPQIPLDFRMFLHIRKYRLPKPVTGTYYSHPGFRLVANALRLLLLRHKVRIARSYHEFQGSELQTQKHHLRPL